MRVFRLSLVVLFLLAPSARANLLSNASFEDPAATTNWTGANWDGSGSAWRAFQGAWLGSRGAWINATTAGEARVWQDVPVATGSYSFCGWLKLEPGANPTNLQLRLEWKDAFTNDVQAASAADFAHLERDALWHHVHVSGLCSSSSLSFVRAVLESKHADGATNPVAILFDDADLYSGAYTGVQYLVNGSFERGGTNDWSWWLGSQWGVVSQHVGNSRHDWWPTSGKWHGVLEGWWSGKGYNYISIFSQNVYPQTTGTWTFSIWLMRQNLFVVSNAQLRLEWRDATYTNKVQADTVSDLAVPGDDAWHKYTVSGSCGNTNLFELRAVATFQYDVTGDNKSMYFDDARLVPDGYTNTIVIDNAYFSHSHFDPAVERVPGTNGYGAFLQPNYARTTTTFYVLGNHPDLAKYPDSESRVNLYTAYQIPGTTNWVSSETNVMAKVGTVVLTTNAPFHGLPASGTLELDVYRCEWAQPCSNGVPYPEPIKVYYAPILSSYYAGTLEDRKYLVLLDGAGTNNYPEFPQLFHSNQWDKDYAYFNVRPQVRTVFTNESFEFPTVVVSNWLNAGWQGYGDATRDEWSARSSPKGAYLPGWFTNRSLNQSGVIQPMAVTGGTYTFAAWLRSDPYVDPNRLELRLEWVTVSGSVVQVDSADLTGFPRDGSWHHAYVSGTCTQRDILYVVPGVHAQFWPRFGDPDRVQVDDAAFYAGSYTGVQTLANTGFERGNPGQFRGSEWYAQTEYVANYRANWGGRRGGSSAVFEGSATNTPPFTTRISQNVAPGPGTYTFAVWMLRDTNFLMTNAEVRLEWYDGTFTNRLQADSATNFVEPADAGWREYVVTGTCADTNLVEVRATVMVQYLASATSNGATARIDDARLFRGGYAPPLILDWGYFGGGTSDPLTEAVPGGDYGSFLQVDYARTTTTFYVLAEHPTIAPDVSVTGVVGMRTAFWSTLITNWLDVKTPMEFVGTAEFTPASPFHGLPPADSHTVSVYRFRWTQPLDALGRPYTNPLTVWYCPYFMTLRDGTDTVENLWLLKSGEIANNYPTNAQLFGDSFYQKDYSYVNLWTPDQDEDSIPDLWELRYFTSITNCRPSEDVDTDARNNLEEYVADSVPTNTASVFHARISAITGTVEGRLRVDAPTTNSRLYDAYWKTNLLTGEPWVQVGGSVSGDGAGGALWLTVTNSPGALFYRTGVRVP